MPSYKYRFYVNFKTQIHVARKADKDTKLINLDNLKNLNI